MKEENSQSTLESKCDVVAYTDDCGFTNRNHGRRNNINFKVPKIEEVDSSDKKNFISSPYRMRDYHENRRDSSTVSDHASVIPWRSSECNFSQRRSSDLPRSRRENTDELICDSSTSPVRRTNDRPHFPVSSESKSSRKSSTEKVEFPRHMSHLTPAEYLANFSRRGHNTENGEPPPSTAASLRSTVLEYPSRNSGSFSSPRHSAVRGKKRMLSVSPISSDLLDLNGIIRTSPNSLVAYVINNEIQHGFASRGSGRNSSAASYGSRGSYGHLDASVSPSLQGYSRPKNYFATPATPQERNMSMKMEEPAPALQESCAQVTSSTCHIPSMQNKFQVESNQDVCLNSPASNTTDSTEARSCVVDGESADDEDGEEQLANFQCLWKDCGQILESQKDLVHHVNTVHIQKNKKDCTCYWQSCTREEKPFKAMYMLVVHVRRHTGEKPHKCHYENCSKAYSRLENLKTHLRSHTGERPYVCEVTGCQKAFSNASDRAKHQNRTHSTVKQYACKVPGCPKRYTDPSSLRKHMKTVHGAVSQPTKKLKGDGPPKKEENYLPNIENDSKEEVERNTTKIKTEPKCKPPKKLQHISTTKHEKQPAPSYRVSSSDGCASMLEGGRFEHQGNVNGNPTHYMNMQKMWNSENVNPSSTTNIERTFIDSNNNTTDICNSNLHNVGADIQVQMPPPAMHTFGPLVKPIEQSVEYANKRLLGNHSMKPRGGPRRGSNASTGSIDSNYTSGVDTYNGSRRGSDVSIQSHLSGGRKSVPAASPLPSRNFSPSRIRQTVIEGEVLENYKESISPPNLTLIMDNSPSDPYMREVTNGMNDHYQVNQLSRLSSGYGSRQNVYLSAKNSARNSPLPMNRHEVRRASEGAVKGVNDYGFYSTPQIPQHSPLRRGSEPANVANIIDSTPRRHSMSGFKPLPIPPSMQQSLNNEPSSNIPSIKQKNEYMACTCVATSTTLKYGVIDSNEQKMMLDRSIHQQWGMDMLPDHQPFSNFPMQNNMDYPKAPAFPLSKAAENVQVYADSTENIHPVGIRDRNLFTEFVEKYHMPKKGFHHPGAIEGHNNMYSNPDMMDQNFNQTFLFNQLNMTETNPNQVVNQNQIYPQSDIVNPQPPYLNHNQPVDENLFIYPQNATTSDLPCNEKQGFSSTLQWRNSHFGEKLMEPDSTDDKNLENMMIRSLGALTTEPCESRLSRAPSNMTVSNMDALLNSFVEENKYFENHTFTKYP